jgi:hypothetical protein
VVAIVGVGLVARIVHGAKVPVSKPPLATSPVVHGVGVMVGEFVAVGVFDAVGVGVFVGTVPVTEGVGVPGGTRLRVPK